MTRDEYKLLIGISKSLKYGDLEAFNIHMVMFLSMAYMRSDSLLVKLFVGELIVGSQKNIFTTRQLFESGLLINPIKNIETLVNIDIEVQYQILSISKIEKPFKSNLFKEFIPDNI